MGGGGIERFELEGEIGRGACSIVYRAFDRQTGQRVAYKRLVSPDPEFFARFEREAEVLSRLSHPGIVRYVDHGVDAAGAPFLAMEWLDGEDLGRKLARERVPLEVALDWARQAAAALAAAHALGVFHRDVKPSNLFVSEGGLKVIDLGIVRLDGARRTETGRILGTPAYIAPEQARGEARIDGRVDVYSLGVTLWQMVAGRLPFDLDDRIATFIRIMTTGVPRLRTALPEVPAWLDELCARATAGEAAERFPTMLDFEAALAAALGRAKEPQPSRRFASVIPPSSSTPRSSTGRIVTAIVAEGLAREGARQVAAAVGGEVDAITWLADGRLLAHLGAERTHGDEVVRAHRVAERLRQEFGARVAITTGKARRLGRGRIEGPVIESAARLLDTAVEPITMDAPTRQLLRRARHEDELPLVGRSAEVATIQAAIERAHEDASATLVLVTGAAGIGKSRLLYEIEIEARRRGEALVLAGNAEPLRQAQGFGVCIDLLRRAIGAPGGGEPELVFAALAAWCCENAPGLDRDDVIQLGYLLGAASDNDPPIASLRGDPRRIRDATWLAATRLIERAGARRPILVTIDDLDQADDASADLLAHWVRRLSDRPIAVVACAHPELLARRPGLLEGVESVRLDLKPLARRACRELARHAAMRPLGEEELERIVAESHGTPLFARELARLGGAVVTAWDAPPERESGEFRHGAAVTLEAAVQARIDALPRRLQACLAIGSLLGGSLWGGALAAMGVHDAEALLDELVERGVAVQKLTSRFEGEREREIRHRLWVELAARSLDHDMAMTAHLAAGRWLREQGEDPAIVGEHLARGGAGEEAAEALEAGAEAAARAGALAAAQKLAFRAAALGEGGRARTRRILLAVRQGLTSSCPAETLRARARALVEHAGDDPLGRAATAWGGGLLFLLGAASDTHVDRVADVARRAARFDEDATAAWALKQAAFALSVTGRVPEAESLLRDVTPALPAADADAAMAIAHARGMVRLNSGRAAAAAEAFGAAFGLAERHRRPALAIEHGSDYAYALIVAGDLDGSFDVLERVYATAVETGADLDQIFQNVVEHAVFAGPHPRMGAPMVQRAFARARAVRADDRSRYGLSLRSVLCAFSSSFPEDPAAQLPSEVLAVAEALVAAGSEAGFWELVSEAECAIALVLARLRRLDEALTRAESGLASASRLDLGIYEVHAALVLHRVARAAGRADRAREALEIAAALMARELQRRAGTRFAPLLLTRFAMGRALTAACVEHGIAPPEPPRA